MATLNKSTVEGAKQIASNLRSSRKRIGGAIGKGLRLAGLALQRESQLLVPVEFGVLKASAFTRAVGREANTVVTVGYTASYAIFVHEKVDMVLRGQERTPSPPHQGRYWDPQGQAQAKFLEAPFRQFRPKAIRIVAAEIRKVL